ncbi:SocA family protein [Brevibacterium sp. JNUCC-42]|nr:SocA family protein [Brevibacterium sp. JNUCC-42]
MPNVFEVAKYFLSKSELNTERSITHLKLQKLIYYAQAWHLAITAGDPLFEERIEAWIHGPVCPELYYKYKHYGFDEIEPVSIYEVDCTKFERKKIEVLDIVWEIYGAYNGKHLEKLTHQEKPWLDARKKMDANTHSNVIISRDSMRKFYSTF